MTALATAPADGGGSVLTPRARDILDARVRRRAYVDAAMRPLVGAAFQDNDDERAAPDGVRRFQAELFDAGLAWPHGPPELGGGGLDAADQILRPAIAAADPGSTPSDGRAWLDVLLGVPAPRIAGGTDEIQRNIVVERGLGLPRGPR